MNNWHLAHSEDLKLISQKIRNEEFFYVPFSAYLCQSIWRHHLYHKPWKILIENNDGADLSSLLITRSGLILPFLQNSQPLPLVLRPTILKHCQSVHSVMGPQQEVLRIQELLGRSYAAVDYSLMIIDSKSFRRPVAPINIEIHRAQQRDTRRLFPLQKAYEIEEVVLDKTQFNDENCYHLLHRNLQAQLTYFGTLNGYPVTKASTNARGFKYDQIGGFFTETKYRRSGYGSAVLTTLLEDIFGTGRSATLFVKQNNSRAIQLYKNIGFTAYGKYRICYYQNYKHHP